MPWPNPLHGHGLCQAWPEAVIVGSQYQLHGIYDHYVGMSLVWYGVYKSFIANLLTVCHPSAPGTECGP